MKVVLILLLVFSLPSQSAVPSNQFLPDELHEPNEPHPYVIKRAAPSPSNFSVFHDRMTRTARVLAGIALQLGLEDGSLTDELAILGLLRLNRALKLDDVENFQRLEMDGFFQRLQTVDVTRDSELDALEKSILMMSALQKRAEIVGGEQYNFTALDLILNEVTKFKNRNFDFSLITNLRRNVEESITDITTFKSMQTATSSDVPLLVGLQGKMRKLSGVGNEIKSFLDRLYILVTEIIKTSVKKTSQFKYLELTEYFLQGRADIQSSTAQDKLNASLSRLASIKPASSDMKTIVHIVAPQLHPPSGFFKGYSDLAKLPQDVSDKWIEKAIPGYNPKKVARSLNPLAPLTYDFFNLDWKKWKDLRTDENFKEVQKLKSIHKSFENLEGNFTEHLEAVKPLLTSPDPQVSTSSAMGVLENCETLREQLNLLLDGLGDLFKWKEFSSLVTLSKDFEKLIGFSADPMGHNAEVATVFPMMKSFTEIDELLESLQEVLPFTEHIENELNRVPLVSLAQSIETDRPEINAFFNNAEIAKLNLYLLDLKFKYKELKSLSSGVKLMHLVRKIQDVQNDNFFKTMKPITKAIEGSLPELQTLRKSMATMRGTTDISGIIGLSSMIIDPAMVFGKAVESVERVLVLKQRVTTMKQLKLDMKTVAKEIEKVSDPVKRKRMKEDWEFTFIYKGVYDMVNLTEIMADVEIFELLGNYTTTFKDLTLATSTMNDYRILNFPEKLQVITDLNNPALDPIKADLTSIFHQLDVNFRELDSTSAPQAIETILDLFYSGHQQPGTFPPYFENPDLYIQPDLKEKPPAKQQLRKPGNQQEVVEVVEVKKSSFGWLLLLILTIFIVVGVIVVIAYCYMREQNPMNQADEDQMC